MNEIDSLSRAGCASGRFSAPALSVFSSMMSTAGYAALGVFEGPVPPHVMIWMPNTNNEDLGGNRPFGTAPFVLAADTPLAVAVVPVGQGIDPSK